MPCVLSLGSVEAFWGAGLGWLLGRKALRPYNDERVHLGYGLAGWTLDGCCVGLGFRGSVYVGLMLVVLWDEMVLDWLRAGLPAVNDVLAHYTALTGAWFPRPYLVRVRFPHLDFRKPSGVGCGNVKSDKLQGEPPIQGARLKR